MPSNGHAKLSPSKAEQWMTCPGSVVLSEGMIEAESGYADEGTRAHAMAEKWLLGHLARHGETPSFKKPEEIEMAKYVKTYIDECLGLTIKGAKVFVEKTVAIDKDVYGTADFIAWHPATATLHIRDLKYGAGVPVDVGRNTQLRIYAFAALITMKLPAAVVSIGIVQPRYEHPDGPVRIVDFDVAELIDLHADVAEAVARVEDAELAAMLCNMAEDVGWQNGFLVPSEKGCRWCAAAPKPCPALLRKSQFLAKQVFSAEPTITSTALVPVNGTAALAPSKLAYDPKALAQALDFLPILEGWIKNTREFAYAEAEKGHEIPDYKLVEKLAVRKWKDGIAVEEVIKALGCGPDEIWKPQELINIGDAVKLAPGKNAKERDAVLEPFVERKSSGHTLVHVSDKRDPIRIDAKAAFAHLDGGSRLQLGLQN
jgi:hypothetical protein